MKVTSTIRIEIPFGDDKFTAQIRPVTSKDIARQRADAVAAAEVQVKLMELNEQLLNASKSSESDAVAAINRTIAEMRKDAREHKRYDIVLDKLVSIGPDESSTGIEGEFDLIDGDDKQLLELTKKADAKTWATTDMRAYNALQSAIADSQTLKTGN